VPLLLTSLFLDRTNTFYEETYSGSFVPMLNNLIKVLLPVSLQARNELRKLDWLDQKRIFLMGHSEGGMTVSRTGIDSFRGVIASGYWCHQGLVVKHATAPFLFLNWREDPWFMGRAASRNPTICQQHADQRPATTQVLLDGRGHATSGSPEAKEAVEKFLKAALTE
jgi:predicted esterase